MSFITSNAPIPTVSQLADPINGEALEISGWFTQWKEDSEFERFDMKAFNNSLAAFLNGGNPIACFRHDRTLPVGEVTAASILPEGLYGTIRLPRPAAGTRAFEVYNAVKTGLVKGFSVGGMFSRKNIAGKVHVFCDRLVEVSLATDPVGAFAVADGVRAVKDVKAFAGGWVPAAEAAALGHEMARIELGMTAAAVALDIYSLRRSL